MLLYHYRSIKSALLEIGNGSFHFSSREELNDPLEGYLKVFWKGDTAAWEGLFRNYICSLYYAITMYYLGSDEAIINNRSLLYDIHRFDNLPIGIVLGKLGKEFLGDCDIHAITSYYGKSDRKVNSKELRMVLLFVHFKALSLCIREDRDRGLLPHEDAERLLTCIPATHNLSELYQKLSDEKEYEEYGSQLFSIAEEIQEDIQEYNIISLFLNETGSGESENSTNRQRRNWIAIFADFPQIYVGQLCQMVYPRSYVVCFSAKNNDSSMWGNYSNNHKGVCLIYDFDGPVSLCGLDKHKEVVTAKAVSYGGDCIERNFFESFGRLTLNQIKEWLTGTEGLSSLWSIFEDDEEGWRNRFWNAFNEKTYRKLKAWEHEQEYRLVVVDSFFDNDESEQRNMRFPYGILKGVIFGIETSEFDKKQIIDKLLSQTSIIGDGFKIFQAYYNEDSQTIDIREKHFWDIRKMNKA